jgi:hypothetical protein
MRRTSVGREDLLKLARDRVSVTGVSPTASGPGRLSDTANTSSRYGARCWSRACAAGGACVRQHAPAAVAKPPCAAPPWCWAGIERGQQTCGSPAGAPEGQRQKPATWSRTAKARDAGPPLVIADPMRARHAALRPRPRDQAIMPFDQVSNARAGDRRIH